MEEKTKIIAFYLPQYHMIEENNLWWGEGFTEWTNVKTAMPQFVGHYQPKIPLNKNYYNLLDYKTLQWQAKLANEYGIDGFCIYHYWFEGKRLLEKPIELLLAHKEIEMPFCLSWANGDWSRTWTGEKEILMKQNYGNKEDWEAHFIYLLQYFKDPRYIKIDGMPVLLLYKAYEIEKCDEMIKYWNKRMEENGFAPIYIIETLTAMNGKCALDSESQACVEFEPLYTIYQRFSKARCIRRKICNHLLFRKKLYSVHYDTVWKNIFSRKQENKKETFYGAFPEWDNTARKGARGMAVIDASPQKFEKYFRVQYLRSMKNKKSFLFINAWNEWGEGAYLEPDELHKYGYLEAIRNVKSI